MGIEFGVNLPIVQAPFRIYYAYNLNRLYSQIAAPNPYVNPATLTTWKTTLDGITPNIWETQIQPATEFLEQSRAVELLRAQDDISFYRGKDVLTARGGREIGIV